MDNKTIGVYDLCRTLDVSATTVYRWIERGLPHTKEQQGLRVVNRFDVEQVMEWLKVEGLGGEG